VPETSTHYRSPVTIVPQSVSGAVESDAIDTAGWEEALLIVHAGAITATGTLDFKAQECDTSDGTYADVDGSDFDQLTHGTEETGFTGILHLGSLAGRKRYLKIVATQATEAAMGCAHLILQQPNFTPTEQAPGETAPAPEAGGGVTPPDPPFFIIHEGGVEP